MSTNKELDRLSIITIRRDSKLRKENIMYSSELVKAIP